MMKLSGFVSKGNWPGLRVFFLIEIVGGLSERLAGGFLSVFGEGFCRAKYGGEGITGVRLSCLWRWLGQWSSGCRKVGRRWQG